LIQGQKLLLVDLDRCTRCGDCVQACIDTHDDGRSRLYLDGPRFDRYLVPSACRNCLNPACMIGCPVGSIQRGDDGQILIRDWCIGCGMCADQCPYDSIQMHDLGLIPARAPGWRVRRAAALSGESWTALSFNDAQWSIGSTPIDWNLELQSLLGRGGTVLDEAVAFRYPFEAAREALASPWELAVRTRGSAASVWLNGRPLTGDFTKGKHFDSSLRGTDWGRFDAVIEGSALRRGDNILAVRIEPPIQAGEPVLHLRLVPTAGELSLGAAGVAEVKQVTERAVVCDLCASLSTGPACVSMCPHEAALRVDARTALGGV
jgi:Fe-S-cluster-containing hydrogenase component 2